MDIGFKHRLIAFRHPLSFNMLTLYYSFMNALTVYFSTDHNKSYFQGEMTHYSNNNGYFKVLCLRKAHSPFICKDGVNIEL